MIDRARLSAKAGGLSERGFFSATGVCMTAASLDIPFGPRFVQRVRFTQGSLNAENAALAELLEPREDGPAPALVVIDEGVAKAVPSIERRVGAYLGKYARRSVMAGPVVFVQGGERVKHDWVGTELVLKAIHEARLCRRSYVVAIGGGAVLDVVGFAAGMAHRGVRLVRVPTTTLGQADSGVAVKNGINAFQKKNYLGLFSPAWGVVNDRDFLGTLSERDWRSGFSEAVKVAAIKDGGLLEQIEAKAAAIAQREVGAAWDVIRRSCELHLRHITDGGDPFELTRARPLDFGHWAAHRLEAVSGYELRHGEAVAIGIAIDVRYSVLKGLLPEADGARIERCLRALGFSLAHAALADPGVLMSGLEEFREHLGGRLTITLLRGIGESVEVHEVDEPLMRAAIEKTAQIGGSAALPRGSMDEDRFQPPHIPVYT